MNCDNILITIASSGNVQFLTCDIAPRHFLKCLDHQYLSSTKLSGSQSLACNIAPAGAGVTVSPLPARIHSKGRDLKSADKYEVCETDSLPSAREYSTSIPRDYFHSPRSRNPYPHLTSVDRKCAIMCGALYDILLSSTHNAIIRIS